MARSVRRAATIAAVVLSSLAALAVVAVVVGTRALESYLRGQGVQELSQQLGRPVSLAEVEARFLPRPYVEVRELAVGGAKGEPVLVAADRAELTVRLWPLLTSLGRRVEVGSVLLKGVDANLVKRADGTWSISEVLARMRQQPSGERQLVVSSFELRDGTLALFDQARPGAQPTMRLTGVALEASDIGPGLPFRARAQADLGGGKPIRAKIEVPRLPASSGDLGGRPIPGLTAGIDAEGVPLDVLGGLLPARLDRVLTGGAVRLHLEASSGEDAYLVEGNAAAEKVQLRGQPAELKLAFRSKVSPANPAGSRLHIHQLEASGPGLDLSGTATVALSPMAVDFDLKGKALDLKQLLSALPPKEEPAAAAAIAPARTRSALQTARVNGKLAIEQVQAGKLQANGLNARVTLRNGVLTAQTAEAQMYGGSAALGGTSVDLKPEVPAWKLRARLQGVEVGDLMQAVGGGVAPMRGSGTVELTARGFGTEWERIRRELTGQGRLTMKDPVLGADLSGEVGTALAEVLARTGQVRPGPVERATQGTRLGPLDATFEVREGWLSLRRPVKVNAPFGSADLGGRVALDQRLDLRGTAHLSPSFVGQVSSGKLKPSGPLDVPMRLSGNLAQPEVGLDVSPTDLLRGMFGRFKLGLGVR